MSRLRDLVSDGDQKLVDATREELRKARQFDVIKAKDVPCKQSDVLARRMDKLNSERATLKLRLGQVTARLNFRLTAASEANVQPLLKAQDNLFAAIGTYDGLIKRTRIQRKLHARSCKRR